MNNYEHFELTLNQENELLEQDIFSLEEISNTVDLVSIGVADNIDLSIIDMDIKTDNTDNIDLSIIDMDINIEHTVGTVIRFHRKRLNLDIIELSKKINIPSWQVKSFEQNNLIPNLLVAKKIANAFNITLDELFIQPQSITDISKQPLINPIKLAEQMEDYYYDFMFIKYLEQLLNFEIAKYKLKKHKPH